MQKEKEMKVRERGKLQGKEGGVGIWERKGKMEKGKKRKGKIFY